jgi:hypothetical protein
MPVINESVKMKQKQSCDQVQLTNMVSVYKFYNNFFTLKTAFHILGHSSNGKFYLSYLEEKKSKSYPFRFKSDPT